MLKSNSCVYANETNIKVTKDNMCQFIYMHIYIDKENPCSLNVIIHEMDHSTFDSSRKDFMKVFTLPCYYQNKVNSSLEDATNN